jgi:hypothetical protein
MDPCILSLDVIISMLCQLQLQRNYPRCSLNKKLDAPHSTPGRFGKQNSIVVGFEYRLRGLQPVA